MGQVAQQQIREVLLNDGVAVLRWARDHAAVSDAEGSVRNHVQREVQLFMSDVSAKGAQYLHHARCGLRTAR